jgi:hypothetical protein
VSGILTAFIGRVASVVTDAYFNLVTLLLPGNGTNGAQNNTFLDSSTNNFTITRNGNTTQGTFSPFSQTGWGVYLNGSSTITAPGGLQTAFAGWGGRTRSWESFIFIGDSTNYSLQSAYAGVAANGRWYIIISSNKLVFGWTTSTSTQTEVTSTASIPLGWSHLTVCVDSTTSANTTIYLGINGVIQTFTGNNLSTQTATYGWNAIFSSGQFLPTSFTGYFTGLRWSDNLRYTSNYTVPTTSFANDANTLFLLGQTNRFLDQSSNNYAITAAAGTPSVQPFSPFLPTIPYSAATVGGSGYFDGAGDYLTGSTPLSSSTSMSTFTVEGWIYPTTFANTIHLIGDMSPTGDTNVLSVRVGTNGDAVLYWFDGAIKTCTSTTFMRLNQWNWFAIVVNSNAISIYVNSTTPGQAGTTTLTNRTQTSNFSVGQYNGSTTPNAYIGSLRWSNGIARTISSIPTAPYTSDANTQLLLNFTNAGITDATAKNVLETVGNAQISTAQSKFGGSSMYFDGSGDYLQVAPNPLFDLRTSDFTVEFWIYPTSFASATYPLYSQLNRSTTNAFAIEINTSGTVFVYVTNSGGAAWSIINAGNIGTLTLNAWNHVAFVRNGSAFRGYVNGVQGALSTNSSNTIETFNGFNIGATGAGTSGYFTGYIDDLRITRFARYTTTFTAPTAAFPLQ